MTAELTWAAQPATDSFHKAACFLTLLGVTGPLAVDPNQCIYLAKDLLRTARLAVLPKDNPGVHKWAGRLRDGDEIPPVLLVVGSIDEDRPLIIAEGYHRVCAAYLRDEATPVACHFLTGGPDGR